MEYNDDTDDDANKGVDRINQKDCEKRTPLHYAYSINNREIIKYLIDNGADKNAIDIIQSNFY